MEFGDGLVVEVTAKIDIGDLGTKRRTKLPYAEIRPRESGQTVTFFGEMCRWSRLVERIVMVLRDHGFIEEVLVREIDKKMQMRLFLKYGWNRQSVIRGLRRLSSPGCRRYVGVEDIPIVFNGLGVSIISTSQGVMTGREAKKRVLGGELLCSVW